MFVKSPESAPTPTLYHSICPVYIEPLLPIPFTRACGKEMCLRITESVLVWKNKRLYYKLTSNSILIHRNRYSWKFLSVFLGSSERIPRNDRVSINYYLYLPSLCFTA